jgi:fatty acid desaturase
MEETMLRHLADLRTLGYLGLMLAVFAILWFFGFDADGSLNFSLCAPMLTLLCFLAIANAVIAHNHNHAPIFHNRWANMVIGCVISFFYGFPSFCWIPTHNQNHHVFNNRPGDYSITTRPRRRVGLIGALLYPTITSLTQARLIPPFLRHCRRHSRFLFRRALVEYAVFFGVMIVLFIIDWRKALLFAVLPQQIGMFFIQHINYLQHIETDSGSEFGHSRNFTGRFLNLFLFNNGYHTVHHKKPGLHWSLTSRAHVELAHKIPQHLMVENFVTFWLRRFVADAVLKRIPLHMTLPAALSPDTLRVTEQGTAKLELAYQQHGLAPWSALKRRPSEPRPEA